MIPAEITVHHQTIEALTRITEEFIRDGYYLERLDWRGVSNDLSWRSRDEHAKLVQAPTSLLRTPSLQKHLRQVARQLKRPFVHGGRRYSMPHYRPGDRTFWGALQIPRQKRAEPLWAPFLFLPDKYDSGKHAMWLRDNAATYIRVEFNDEAAFDEVTEKWRTDPVCRKALGLPHE